MRSENKALGFLKSWNPEKKFGFVSCPAVGVKFGKDVYYKPPSGKLQEGIKTGNYVEFSWHLQRMGGGGANAQGQPQTRELFMPPISFLRPISLYRPNPYRMVGIVKSFRVVMQDGGQKPNLNKSFGFISIHPQDYPELFGPDGK